MGELKALHIIMCKRDTESVKVEPESVLSNSVVWNVKGTHLTAVA